MAVRKQQKVVKMKRKPHLWTGILLLLFSAYVAVLFIQSLTREHISITEVTEKNIADDNTVRGIILRKEELVTAKRSGYINYYVGESSKIGVKNTIYSVDSDGRIASQLAEAGQEDVELSSEDTANIRSTISAFRNAYDLSHYNEIYNFKYNMENTLLELTNANLLESLTQIMDSTQTDNSFKLVKAKQSGIISYTSDGMENLSLNDITEDSFSDTNDKLSQLRQTEQIEEGSPVYRLVTSENWSVVVPLTKNQFTAIQQKDSVNIILKKIGVRVSAAVTTFTIDDGYYAKMDLNRYMIQYLNNRYLDIEIELNDVAGLKIPVSSILTKQFYVIPASYVTTDANGDEGIVVCSYDEKGTPVYRLETTRICYPSEEDAEECYVDASQFEAGTVISDSSAGGNTYILSDTVELEGVYNCNKGYCEFRQVEKIYENSEYYIVSKDTKNGLSAYDHIILNPDMIGEDEIIY